ncbi:hypothetical protein ATO6_00490 [Oceanicola sp. 22II-s10i]|uniref:chorismate mutase n=1 Tax=Oceanicola sp. 22II-s10i TaxID=1317116 RepID=UPI000B51ED35|nr:chorismate mutase [Oceanicola sp. 22II-s10i]OWU85468.1 hypothetical protein ATO6_00490 [Oceanicola sp. 22II-s10i]
MTRRHPDEIDTLDGLRAQIDAIDSEVLRLLGERTAHVDRVAVIKHATGVSAAAPGRYAAVIASVRDRAAAAGMDPDMAEAMWRVMIEGFIAREEKVLGTGGVDG